MAKTALPSSLHFGGARHPAFCPKKRERLQPLLPGRYVQAYRHNNMPIAKYDNNEKNSFTNFTSDNLD
jgi:hypothetical protein